MAKPLKIYFPPYEVLHQKSTEVKVFDQALKDLLDDILETVRRFDGVGLSANQIGLPIRAFVVDSDNCLKAGQEKQHGNVPLKMINPIISGQSEEQYSPEEGCMSLPSINATVKRYKWIDVDYFDENGKKCRIEKADGLMGQCIQHENDHINGILITDYSSELKKDFMMRKLRKFLKFHDVYKDDEIVDARIVYKQFI